jgi:hypothetical protein
MSWNAKLHTKRTALSRYGRATQLDFGGKVSKPPKFQIGSTAPDGNKIEFIYGQTDAILVFRAPNESIVHYVNESEVSEHVNKVLVLHSTIHDEGFRAFGNVDWPSIRDPIGSALFNALSAPDDEGVVAAFAPVRTAISERKQQNIARRNLRLGYLISATVAALVFGVVGALLYIYYPVVRQRIYFACMTAAVCGAFASVITRVSNVDVDLSESHWIVLFRGSFRIILAILLSSFMIAAAKANLIAGILVSSQWSYVAYAFVCGFSERFGHDILSSLEKPKKRTSSPE